jgi:hypothetical protein
MEILQRWGDYHTALLQYGVQIIFKVLFLYLAFCQHQFKEVI